MNLGNMNIGDAIARQLNESGELYVTPACNPFCPMVKYLKMLQKSIDRIHHIYRSICVLLF